ncbi:MAG TPA: hypothetical protein VI544_02415, partial [Candidatus Nanoarchaeia archaeon]|nr:hypothetical protein [Candidatus Nanoarchaeia archaeon]
MEAKKQYFKVGSQIFILVVATIAFSYFAHETFSGFDSGLIGKNKSSIFGSLLFLLKIVNKLIWSEKTIVSAQSIPIYTCMKANDGRVCAEYTYDQCDSKCKESCIPSLSKDITACKIGTCYNSVEGTCAIGAIKKSCEDGAGVWIDDPNGNTLQCKKGCCIIGGESRFSTAGECTRVSQILGIEKNFKPEINTELACLIGSATEKEGACLLGKDTLTQKNLCKFTTKGSCSTLKGEFYSEILCSHPDLETNCEKQKTTSCIQGKSEIYWFDSCGNKENIYSADNVKSWNGGRVLIKDESCSLGSGSNFLANQGTCGNCNYYAGSTCGIKSGTEKLDDSLQDVVCKDLS